MDAYRHTRKALAAYDARPTSCQADLVQIAFWDEARASGQYPAPSLETIRHVIGPDQWMCHDCRGWQALTVRTCHRCGKDRQWEGFLGALGDEAE